VSSTDVAIVVAVGPLDRGKSRLGPMLAPADRRRLVLAMLDDVLAAVGAAHDGPRFVVTPDPEVDPLVLAHGAAVIRDGGGGTNAAIEAALADGRVAAAEAVLVVQGDLPHLAAGHVRDCLDELASSPRLGLLVASDDGGTLALGIRPPNAMLTAFGAQSGQRHREAAATAGLELRELQISQLAADVDTVEDLEQVRAAVGPATAAVLEALTVITGDGASL